MRTNSGKFLILFLIFKIPVMLMAQTEFKKNVYRRTSKVIQKDFPSKNTFENKKLLQSKLLFSIYELQCIGEYKNSLSKYDSCGSAQFSFIDSLNNYKSVANYYTAPAKQMILKNAKNHRVVIINESHDQPLHRIFVSSLLRNLYDQGYHYLAIEALNNDSSLNQKNKPIISDGYYTTEPRFSNMLKEAADIGYHFVAYDVFNKNREYNAALTIKEKTFDQDSTAKILVYCGFSHVDENLTSDSTMRLAGWLKKITKFDPLTIDQECLTEHSSRDYEKTSYSFLNVTSSSIFINKNDSTQTFIPFDRDTQCDLYVYHPRTTYMDKRPTWLSESVEWKEYFLPQANIRIKYPLLILAYSINEQIDTNIPTDAMELKNKNELKPLILKTGKYKILLRNNFEEEQIIEIEIK